MPSAPPPPPAIPETGAVPWLEFLKSILFWAILLGIVGYSLVYYIRERRDLLLAARQLPFYSALERFWRWLASWLSRIPRGVGAAVEARRERLRLARQSSPRPQLTAYLNLRRLSPRQRVVFYYLAMVRRAGEAGLMRKSYQTPYDYSHKLSQGLGEAVQAAPEIEQDITALTEKFVEARYSLHPVTAEEVGLVQGWWKKIRQVLSRRRL